MKPEIELLVAELTLFNSMFADGRIGSMTLDELADLSVKISAYKVFLGEHVAALERDADLAEAHYELVREQAYRDTRKSGATGADSDNAKRIQSAIEKEAWIDAKYQFKVVSNLWRDTSSLLDTLRSRLSYEKIELGEAKR
ncbi:hypothetical protein [Arthrobacter sp. NicSoilC5]|uniref:hypothetical protein n=1 Tax=Arthrobacter sp. NicSoilC5 TaxID=2831000 RepID=UPI001CC6E91A|nr:hypothetical protein [Arthrobacter sp. NicSoilC5]BCW78306.1 hypothetical protein NicSoilC5_03250 [Arthrobacter sp. NicSoilC5]